MKKFDILVIGGGHAGVEAAHIASQFNLNVGLVTLPGVGLASAPCNPSVGGVGKGQVVREIDALGGLMGVLADEAGIQYRTLNDSKGFAVQSTRVQIDKDLYSKNAEKIIASIKNIEVIREKVIKISKTDNFIVNTTAGIIEAKKIVVTVGTFLNGKLHTGADQAIGGRVGCEASSGLGDIFSVLRVSPQRFKTGTPPRIKKDSINFLKLEEQPSDSSVRNFHSMNDPFKRRSNQVSCWLGRTNNKTMEIIRFNKEQSPMFNGQIQGVGARYCPSIEDKAFRYPDKDIHHVFIEPEGLNLDTMYPSGISSSLPRDIQDQYVRSIVGLEEANIDTYGYAVEYDVINTVDLRQTLEHGEVNGLYFAGQVNGTSGYEEAAGQGLIAGINAAISINEGKPFILSRHDSYIGIMVEDLTSNTRDEPYRLFTARSENRLYIREDNSIARLWSYRTSLNLNTKLDQYQSSFMDKYQIMMEYCDEVRIPENSPLLLKFSGEGDSQKLIKTITLTELLRQAWLDPVKTLEEVLLYFGMIVNYDVIRTVAISKKYEGYIKRSEDQFAKVKKLEKMKINWQELGKSSNISFECKQRILKIKPETFGQLKLIEGIRPATLAVVASRAE